MNGKQLLEAMGAVDERYVQEAEDVQLSRPHAVRWAALAAAACLCLAALWMVDGFLNLGKSTEKSGADDNTEVIVSGDGTPYGAPITEQADSFVILRLEQDVSGDLTGVIEEAGSFDTLVPGLKVQVLSVSSDREIAAGQKAENTPENAEDTPENSAQAAQGQRLRVHVVSYDPETNILIIDSAAVLQEEG